MGARSTKCSPPRGVKTHLPQADYLPPMVLLSKPQRVQGLRRG